MTTLYPARVVGTQVVHLARTEARSDDVPALFAICPDGAGIVAGLELVPTEDEHLVVWCPSCKAYLDHITPTEAISVEERAATAEEAKRILRSSILAAQQPSAPAPEWMLRE